MVHYNRAERLGVSAVQHITVRDLCWVFREQPTVDLGIDAYIELVQDHQATGKLIAAQIKTGRSHFRETPDALIYYGDTVKVKYWAGYSLPVILVAYLPDTDEAFWVPVNTNTGGKIAIPKANKFGLPTQRKLLSLFENRTASTQPSGLSPASIPRVVSRLVLHERFGGSRRAGISVSTRSPDVFLISVGGTENTVVFLDGWKEDGCFTTAVSAWGLGPEVIEQSLRRRKGAAPCTFSKGPVTRSSTRERLSWILASRITGLMLPRRVAQRGKRSSFFDSDPSIDPQNPHPTTSRLSAAGLRNARNTMFAQARWYRPP